MSSVHQNNAHSFSHSTPKPTPSLLRTLGYFLLASLMLALGIGCVFILNDFGDLAMFMAVCYGLASGVLCMHTLKLFCDWYFSG